ncbi:hypothetical protein D3C71_1020780 [compost metagenome]
MGEDVHHEEIEGHHHHDGLDHYLPAGEPVLGFPPVQRHLQRPYPQAQQGKAQQIEAAAGIELGLLDEGGEPEPGQQAERQVDVEHPAPVVVLGEPAPQRRPEDGAHHDTYAPHRHGGAVLLGRIGIEQHRLGEGHQAGAEDPLQQPEQHYLIQALGRATQHGGDGKARHRPHKQSFSTNSCRDKAGQWHEDGGRHYVGGEHPGDLILGRPHGPLHVGQGDVGDGGVQRLHDGGQHHRQCDEGAAGDLAGLLCGCCRHINLDLTSRAECAGGRYRFRRWRSGRRAGWADPPRPPA